MKPLLLALLVCAACKHSTSSSSTSHTETQTVTDTQTSESGTTTTTTTVTEQPGETTTTTEEFGPPDEKEAAPEQEPPQSIAGDSQAHAKVPATIPRHGPLVKRTVTTTRSGGETTQTRQEATQQATGASETKAAGKVDTQARAQTASAPSAGCVGASWIWGLAVLVGVGGIVYGVVRFRKAV